MKAPSRGNVEGLLAAAALGLVVVTTTGPVPLAVLGALLLGATAVIVNLQATPDAVRFLSRLIFAAIAVRLLVFFAVRQTVGPYVFAPDAMEYERIGMGVLRALGGYAPMPGKVAASLQVGYYYVNALLFGVFGENPDLPALLNVFLMSWIAVPVYYMTLALVRNHDKTARWAAALCAFFPSIILWSVLNIREAPTTLVLTLLVYLLVRIQKLASFWDLAFIVVLLGVLATFREYLAVLVGIAGPVGIMVSKSARVGRSFVAGGLILGAIFFALNQLGLGGSLTEEPTLNTLEYLRRDMARGAGSQYGQGFNVSTVPGALGFLPVGLAFFLLAPFPWSLQSALQVITLPEVLIWYALIPFILRGLFLALKHDGRAFASILAVLGTVMLGYALVEGNVGTAYRHRAQILPLFFVFAAVGLVDAQAVWMRRRGTSARSRARGGPRRVPHADAGSRT